VSPLGTATMKKLCADKKYHVLFRICIAKPR